MSSICPKDCRPCIDDLCRGSGVCLVTNDALWDQCDRCHGVYSHDYGVECACEPEYEDEDITRCGGSGMVAYWDGSALAGEMCPGCEDCDEHTAALRRREDE